MHILRFGFILLVAIMILLGLILGQMRDSDYNGKALGNVNNPFRIDGLGSPPAIDAVWDGLVGVGSLTAEAKWPHKWTFFDRSSTGWKYSAGFYIGIFIFLAVFAGAYYGRRRLAVT